MSGSHSTRLRRILLRDLRGAQEQLAAYPDDESVWALPEGVNNSAGTLALHMAGNLRHFIGAQLGGSGFVRDRDAEFSRRDVARADLVTELKAAAEEVEVALTPLDDEALEAEYPLAFGDIRLETGMFVTHLATHLAYHLGQMDLHRRVVTGEAKAVPTLTFKDLV